jgi:hypothetical protein
MTNVARFFFAGLAALALVRCGTSSPDDIPPPVVAVKQVCPAVKTWQPAELGMLATSMAAVPMASPIWIMEMEWQSLRDQARACTKAQQ